MSTARRPAWIRDISASTAAGWVLMKAQRLAGQGGMITPPGVPGRGAIQAMHPDKVADMIRAALPEAQVRVDFAQAPECIGQVKRRVLDGGAA